MSKNVKYLGIEFDGNVFSGGGVIKGRVVVKVDGDGLNNVKGIWVRFRGKAKTKWTTSSGNNNTTTHSKRENYFDAIHILCGTSKYQRDVRDINIPAGVKSFPFTFQLQNKPYPAPFEGKYGYVRYKAKATLSLIKMFSNKSFKTEKCFSMTGPVVDLNTNNNLKLGARRVEDLYDCCSCGNTKNTTITLEVKKRGYVPGESIYFIGKFDNTDGLEARTFHAKLTQEVIFSTNHSSKRKERILAAVDAAVICRKGNVQQFIVGPLRIPPVPSSGLPGCNIIDVSYHIKCQDSECRLSLPIVIGTVPLRMPVDDLQVIPRPSQVIATAPSASPDAGIVLTGLPEASDPAPAYNFYDVPPPSYEEAVGEIERVPCDNRNTDTEEHFAGARFVPSYPYFQMSASAPPLIDQH